MKKILVVLSLLLLSGCGSKYYTLTIDEEKIVVGKDKSEVITSDKVDYEVYVDENGNEYLKEVSFLKDEVGNIKIDDYEISGGVKDTCAELEGEYHYELNEVCLIHKNVRNRENYIIISGNVLNDDVDEIDNIKIGYDY